MLGQAVLFRPLEGFGVPFVPGGVGDFGQNGRGAVAAVVPCIVKGHGIEAVPEGSKVSQHGDWAFHSVAELLVHG